MDEQHPALRLNRDPTVIAEALRQALASVIGLESGAAEPELAATPWTSSLSESELYDETTLGSERTE
jgi:hypothetical protein